VSIVILVYIHYKHKERDETTVSCMFDTMTWLSVTVLVCNTYWTRFQIYIRQ